MKKAVVTGASSGIGKEISNILSKNGYFVFGFGRVFSESENENFKPIICDFLKTNEISEKISKLNKENEINVLVNCAGIAYYGLHEELNSRKIHEMTVVNVEAPLLITQLLMRNLKRNQGHIINISSVTAKKSSPHGAAYGATKAALSAFSMSLFDEARKYGVKVSSIYPDMTNTNLYRNADFQTAPDKEFHILPQEVAQAVFEIINSRINITELTMQPQKHKISKLTNTAPLQQ